MSKVYIRFAVAITTLAASACLPGESIAAKSRNHFRSAHFDNRKSGTILLTGRHQKSIAHDQISQEGAEQSRSFMGMASFYASHQRLASGGSFAPSGYTCAHRSLPFGTRLRVADPISGRSVVVTVNDRGPYVHGRVLDLSLAAARALGMTDKGVMRVEAHVI